MAGLRYLFVFVCVSMSFAENGSDWPLSEQSIEPILRRNTKYEKLKEQDKAWRRRTFLHSVKLASGESALMAFMGYLTPRWNAADDESRKGELIKSAQQEALKAGRQRLAALFNLKDANGAPASAGIIEAHIHERLSMNQSAWEEFHKFIDDRGELDFNIAYFSRSGCTIKEVPQDLIRCLQARFPGSPAKREKQRQAEEATLRLRIERCALPSNSSRSPTACGVPSSHAAPLRPESNGSR